MPGARIQLGAFRSYANAVAHWNSVRVAAPALLQGGIPCVREYPAEARLSPLHHLQVQVDTSYAAAIELCGKLRGRGIECLPLDGAQAQSCMRSPKLRPVPAGSQEATETPPVTAEQVQAALSREPSSTLEREPPIRLPEESDLHREAVAQGIWTPPNEVQKEFLIDFDIDAPPKTDIPLGPNLSYGAKLTFESKYADDLDLDRRADDKLHDLSPDMDVAFTFTPSEDFWGFARFSLSKRFLLDDPAGRSSDPTELDVSQAYIVYSGWAPGWALQMGRQKFKDEREWLYDENLDGLRLFYRRENFGVEISVTQEGLFPKDLLNSDNNRHHITNWMALARFASDPDDYVDTYVLFRDDHDNRPNREEDLVFLGLHAQGPLGKRTDYWLDTALVGGQRRNRDIRGWGFDLGATHVFDVGWKPSLTLAWAFGSGDGNRSDDVDRSFRQTDLQGNSGRFAGVASFNYYGETLGPELSNLIIFTLGAGIRPLKNTSLDLVYHNYWQHHADDDIRDSELEMDPDGDDRHLGQGLDLVFGHRWDRSTINWVIGAFKPGRAFPGDAETATFSELKFQRRF